jgi:hypothetical protein
MTYSDYKVTFFFSNGSTSSTVRASNALAAIEKATDTVRAIVAESIGVTAEIV